MYNLSFYLLHHRTFRIFTIWNLEKISTLVELIDNFCISMDDSIDISQVY